MRVSFVEEGRVAEFGEVVLLFLAVDVHGRLLSAWLILRRTGSGGSSRRGATWCRSSTHFARQLHKERVARGWSLREFAERTGLHPGHASRIETGKRPPTANVATACDAVFPGRKGWFTGYYEKLGGWSEVPAAFRDWSDLWALVDPVVFCRLTENRHWTHGPVPKLVHRHFGVLATECCAGPRQGAQPWSGQQARPATVNGARDRQAAVQRR